MNFLIISGARCGSSSLQKAIARYYNLKIIFEPFSPWGVQRKKFTYQNIIVKTILHQIKGKAPKYGSITSSHFDECFDFYSQLIPKFEKVILLTRENEIEHAESIAALQSGNDFEMKYVYDLKIDLEPIINDLIIEKNYIKKLGNHFNLPIDTYESIYYGDGIKDRDISLDYSFIDTKNKLRQTSVNKTLL